MPESTAFVPPRLPPMPIKFRCPHCQQFLGISRSRAGAVTDCPMCGRAIRVPLLDGSTPPLPAPELNLGDRGLASALDKLAGLASGEAPPAVAAALEGRVAVAAAPVALPEPIELEPAPAAVVVLAEPLPEPPPVRTIPVAERRPTEDVLASLVSAGEREQQARRATESRHGSAGIRRLAVWGGLAATAIGAAFGVGYEVGRRGATASDTSGATTPAAAPAALPPVAAVAPTEPALIGRISYVAADGEVRPDAGARLLLLPEERQGTAKLAADGFRSGAAEADLRLATASLRAIGGDFVSAANDGSYSLTLPQAGVYQLLIVSRYQPRPEGAAADAAALQLLSNYFERPAQVVGDAAVHVSQYRFRGSGTSTRDHTFEGM